MRASSPFLRFHTIMWNLKGASKLCSDRDVEREHVKHIEKLRSIKSRIDNKPPRQHSHLLYKAKKEKLEHERSASIQYENHLLLQKMLKIDKKPTQVSPLASNPSAGSLNRVVRTRELTKISAENRQILKRLQSAQPHYNTKRWDEEHRYTKYLSHKLSENAGRIPRIPGIGSSENTNTSFSRSRPSSAGVNRRPEVSARFATDGTSGRIL